MTRRLSLVAALLMIVACAQTPMASDDDAGAAPYALPLGVSPRDLVIGPDGTAIANVSTAASTQPITVTVGGLPAGATADPLTLPPGTTTATVTIHASGLAPGITPLLFTATSPDHGTGVIRTPLISGPITHGILDPTFGSDGVATFDVVDGGSVQLVDAAGGLILSTGTQLIRMTSAGTLDAAFQPIPTPDRPIHVADGGQGRILVTSFMATSSTIRRYLAGGAVDTTFGTGGATTFAEPDIVGAAVQHDGTLAVVGYFSLIHDPGYVYWLHLDANGVALGAPLHSPFHVNSAILDAVHLRDDGWLLVGDVNERLMSDGTEQVGFITNPATLSAGAQPTTGFVVSGTDLSGHGLVRWIDANGATLHETSSSEKGVSSVFGSGAKTYVAELSATPRISEVDDAGNPVTTFGANGQSLLDAYFVDPVVALSPGATDAQGRIFVAVGTGVGGHLSTVATILCLVP